jgi:hypothetical protein
VAGLLVGAVIALVAISGAVNPIALFEFFHGSSVVSLLYVAASVILIAVLLVDTRYRRPAWIIFATMGAIGAVLIVAFHLRFDPLVDVHAYYEAGGRLNAGLPLYAAQGDINSAHYYFYPPLLAIVFRPLAALFSYEQAATLWGLFCLVTFILTLRRLDFGRFEVRVALGALGIAIGWSLAIGQAQTLVTWLLTIGSPWAVALAANLKVFPVLVAAYWVGRREWRKLGSFAATMAGLALVQLILEPAGTLAFLGITNLSEVGGVDNNFSLYGLSPLLWAALAIAGGLLVLRLAPTKAGWAAAIALSVLVTPRLLIYMFSTLLASLRRAPKDALEADLPPRQNQRTKKA